ncbi:MAG: hypothetical protein ACXIVF_04450 [Rhizobiaceae bacterium]
MPRRTDNLFSNYNTEKPTPNRSSGWLRASAEWIAVALVLAAGVAILLLYFD